MSLACSVCFVSGDGMLSAGLSLQGLPSHPLALLPGDLFLAGFVYQTSCNVLLINVIFPRKKKSNMKMQTLCPKKNTFYYVNMLKIVELLS